MTDKQQINRKTPAEISVLIVGYIWLLGLSATALCCSGYALYFILMLIFGAVLTIACPCIGLGVIGATIGIWGMLYVIAIGIMLYTACIASAVALLTPLSLLGTRNSRLVTLVISVFVLHILLGVYLDKIGAVNMVLNNFPPHAENVIDVISVIRGKGKTIINNHKLNENKNNNIDNVDLNTSNKTKHQIKDAEPYEVTLDNPICEYTSIESISTRLEGAEESGTAINYANGIYGVDYFNVPEISERSLIGDPIKLCLISEYVNCPKGDNRGKTYRAINLRTHETWSLPNASHICGGA